jgi:nucleoporin NDC1
MVFGVNARTHLNERPLYYLSLFFTLALIQVAYHLALDLDRIEFPIKKNGATLDASPPFLSRKAAGKLAATSMIKSFVAATVGTAGYRFIYRNLLWEQAFGLLDYLYSFPKNSYNRRNYHYDLGGLFVKFLCAAFFLCFLWDLSNALFSYYLVKAPLKKGKPITDDSKDPNGSLVNGLKDKRPYRQVRRAGHCYIC